MSPKDHAKGELLIATYYFLTDMNRTFCLFIYLNFGLAIARPEHHWDVVKNRKIREKNEEESMNIKLYDDKWDRLMHPIMDSTWQKSSDSRKPVGWSTLETETNHWYDEAQEALNKQLQKKFNTNVAKNIIFFMGDGLSVPTLFAARTYQGQLEGKSGEEGQLFWESFPFTGFSKTWCIDKQVPDSACTSTAYMTGVKSKFGTVGLNGKVIRGSCETQNDTKNHVDSFLKWAQDQGKSVGIVTTTRVTHASPAGGYAHAADRTWESDTDILEDGADPEKCMDIAQQLITQDPGKDFKVILGGGRQKFLPKETYDEEGDPGDRSDRRNLIEEWKNDKAARGSKFFYSWNRTTLIQTMKNPESHDFFLGLYGSFHMPYHLESNPETDPTLAEMTETALKLLKKNEKGFVLFVEGGRIDHAHHRAYATLALDETLELAKAVETGWKMTSPDDTLLIITADHAHTMSVAGYSDRGAKINGINTKMGDDSLEYMTLSYANGPGYRDPAESGARYNISIDDIADPRYQFPSMVPLASETHGGEDVAIFANGPWAHLFTGTIQQSNIPHFLAYASCLTDKNACDN